MQPFKIETREQYDLCKAHGIEPLVDRRFPMAISLRKEIQWELFGKGHSPEENERFYRYCWKVYPHICQECMKPLGAYSAVYVDVDEKGGLLVKKEDGEIVTLSSGDVSVKPT